VLAHRFIEVAVVTTERDHLIVGSAMRFAERGGVLRRVPSFSGLELQRSGRLALRLAAGGIVVTSKEELEQLNHTGWAIPATVAPLGVDLKSYDDVEPATRGDMRMPAQRLVIACSYDLSGRHRMGGVFRTVALLAPRHLSIHVVVFGRGSADDELRMHAAALGVTPIVSFLGEVKDERKIIRAAHAGWVVSSGDTGAFACLDFMACRVPVIGDQCRLTRHYVADGSTGVLLSRNDASDTAARIAAFLLDESKRVAMGNAGRARVQREFTESAMIDGFERAAKAAGDRTKWVTK
jgi:glycosyltransferase involved in cell wall biosynthesis